MPDVKLSARERECLEWVAHGKSDWDIAQILMVGEATVAQHLQNVLRKYGVKTRVEALAIGIANKDIER